MNYDILLLLPTMAVPVYLFWDLYKYINTPSPLFQDVSIDNDADHK
jgi:hypothetical protein